MSRKAKARLRELAMQPILFTYFCMFGPVCNQRLYEMLDRTSSSHSMISVPANCQLQSRWPPFSLVRLCPEEVNKEGEQLSSLLRRLQK